MSRRSQQGNTTKRLLLVYKKKNDDFATSDDHLSRKKMVTMFVRVLAFSALTFGAHAFSAPRIHSLRASTQLAVKSPFQFNAPDFSAIFGGDKQSTLVRGTSSIGKGDRVAVSACAAQPRYLSSVNQLTLNFNIMSIAAVLCI